MRFWTVVSGLRYYTPGFGRWVRRDPIGEWGGLNAYAYCANRSADRFDALGLSDNVCGCPEELPDERDGEVRQVRSLSAEPVWLSRGKEPGVSAQGTASLFAGLHTGILVGVSKDKVIWWQWRKSVKRFSRASWGDRKCCCYEVKEWRNTLVRYENDGTYGYEVIWVFGRCKKLYSQPDVPTKRACEKACWDAFKWEQWWIDWPPPPIPKECKIDPAELDYGIHDPAPFPPRFPRRR